ncbi:MAG: hydroxyisourate hydrolase [Gemmatimonadaceae bacterium]
MSTHVLDTSGGQPASGVRVSLELVAVGGSARVIAQDTTDADGRIRDVGGAEGVPGPGVYRLRFDTDHHFRESGQGEAFFPEVTITFRVAAGVSHYHVPLLLSPYGYTTYRGS